MGESEIMGSMIGRHQWTCSFDQILEPFVSLNLVIFNYFVTKQVELIDYTIPRIVVAEGHVSLSLHSSLELSQGNFPE